MALDLTGYHIAHDDTARLAVHDYQVEHVVAVVRGDLTLAHLTLERGIATQQQLLARLTGCVERTRNLCAPEGTVVQFSTVIPGKGYALSHALVDDVSRYFCQTVNVSFAGTVVAALDRIVVQTIGGVAVVRIVLIGIDTALGGDGVRTAGGVLIEECFYIVSQFGQGSSRRTAGQTGTYHDDVYLAFVGRIDQAHMVLVVFPLLRQRPLRDLRIEYVFAHCLFFLLVEIQLTIRLRNGSTGPRR